MGDTFMDENIQDLKDIEEEHANVLDDASADESSAPQTYNISSYGADFDVDGLVKRLRKGDIFIPPFQRDYVWNLSDASRLIESLLLGLPVPGVFFAKDIDTNKSLVIDGQQRLKSLLFFYDGYFNPKPDQKTRRIFKLLNVQPQFEGKTYEELDEKDRVRLNDSIIHATVIKQESPQGDDTSVYHVFERLNTGGHKLMPQEIRTAIFHGGLIELMRQLNMTPEWRAIFGKESKRLKDQELILRFLAMYFTGSKYTKPMNEFINKFSKTNRNLNQEFNTQCTNLFKQTIHVIHQTIGNNAFRPERALNAAVFDSVMVGLAKRLQSGKETPLGAIKPAYDQLLADKEFKSVTSESTSDVTNVSKRLELAIAKFASI